MRAQPKSKIARHNRLNYSPAKTQPGFSRTRLTPGDGGEMRQVFQSTVLLLFAFCAYAFTQTANATLGGTIADTTGALIPGVMVTATNTETGIVNTTLTNEAGVYQFASLQPG